MIINPGILINPRKEIINTINLLSVYLLKMLLIIHYPNNEFYYLYKYFCMFYIKHFTLKVHGVLLLLKFYTRENEMMYGI